MPPHECSYCERSFNRAEHLLRHVRSHTKEKPFKCGACGKGYSREDTLIRHAKSHCIKRRATFSEGSGYRGDLGSNGDDLLPPRHRTPILSTPPTALEIPNATPTYPVADFTLGSQIWGFHSMGFMDDASLWAANHGFLASGMDTTGAPLSSLPDTDVSQLEPLGNHHHGRGQQDARGTGTAPPAAIDVRELWFTRIPRTTEKQHYPQLSPSISNSGPAASPSESEIVDEECRRELRKALVRPIYQEDFLPSSSFLNICVRRFLKCFNPIFPILHAPTFQPTAENGPLLVSMASVGCLFLGSADAVQRGIRMFEGLNRFILTSNNTSKHARGDMFAMIQAAVIGQTFAMLSGDARHFAIFESYHGSIIAFARRENIFDSGHTITGPLENLSGEELEMAWKQWIREEEILRIVPALRIHDAELSSLLHRDSLLKHAKPMRQSIATHRAFGAATAPEWLSAIRAAESPAPEGNTRPNSVQDSFTAHIQLESRAVCIAEDRREGRLDAATSSAHQQALIDWHEAYSDVLAEGVSDRMCLIALWHWVYMSLFVDVEKLELAIGRDGPEKSPDAISYVRRWAETPDAARCMMHAFFLQKNLQALRFDDIPALHVPRLLFSAAVAWYCYIHNGPGNNPLDPSGTLFNTSFLELRVMTASNAGQLSCIANLTWNQSATSSIIAATVCELGCQLRRINEWGLAGKFASVVARLLDAEA
ncbi:hypothetical protein JHW43_004557 [Diplocarpon mali]|nr:hypothetical protein JHW43_004557 [Diplocarpon mali]